MSDGARRTDPLGLAVHAISALKNAALPVIFILYSVDATMIALPLALFAGLLIVAISFGAAWLAWHRLTYAVGTDDIRVESGILSRAARSVPYERIQDVSLEQSLIPRLLGLVEVRFETGAGGKDEIKLAFLREADGEGLRELVRERREGQAPGAAASAGAPAEEVPLLFAMDTRRLLTFGVFEFSLVVVAVLGGLAQQFDFLLPFDIWDFEAWETQLAGPGAWLAGLGPVAQALGILFGAVSLVLLGLATGIVRTALRDWGFTLEKTSKGFRRRRGLLTRTDVVMPVHRVQALVATTGIVRRRFGWHGLKFVSLAQDAGSSSHVVAPFAKWRELVPIMRAARFEPPVETLHWRPASRAFRTDRALLSALTVLPAAAILALADYGGWALALLPLGALLALRQAFLWRFERHALDDQQLYTRRGWLAPRSTIASRVKLQSAEIACGPLGRYRGYATLHLGLAGGTLAIPGIPITRAQQLRSAILESIETVDFSQLAGDAAGDRQGNEDGFPPH